MANDISKLPKSERQQGRLKKAHTRTRHHYYRVMPNKRRHRVLIWVLFLLYATIVALQMLYPPDKALPLASIFGENVAWQSDEELAKRVYGVSQSAKLKLTIGNKEVIELLGKAGAEPRTDVMIAQMTEYPFWQRFIPLSIFWQSAQIDYLGVIYTDRVLDVFVKEASDTLQTQPVDARLSIEDGKLNAVADKAGRRIDTDVLRTLIKQTFIQPGTNVVRVPTVKVEAKVTARGFASVKSTAEAALERPIEIVVAQKPNETFSPDRKTVASWLTIAEKKGEPVLGFDAKRYGKYLDTIDNTVGRKSGITNVTITDGKETKRTVGITGRKIDRSPLIDDTKAWLLEGEGQQPLTTKLHDVSPELIYNNKYTTTEAGLRAYIKDLSKQMDVHIAIRQVGGSGWTAEARANDSMPSASTYKLYVAKWLFDEMDAGRTSWSSSILGTTVSDCFDQMTIASTNACAQEWLRQAGRTNINNYVWKLGFSRGTTFTHPEATHSTANDLLRFMVKLNEGSIVGGAHRDRLLHSLNVHPYRSGIPAGSNGKVYDKVGFLWDYVHDAAIVKHPRGTYVMVVMTKGQSYGRIAEITRQVERIMYP